MNPSEMIQEGKGDAFGDATGDFFRSKSKGSSIFSRIKKALTPGPSPEEIARRKANFERIERQGKEADAFMTKQRSEGEARLKLKVQDNDTGVGRKLTKFISKAQDVSSSDISAAAFVHGYASIRHIEERKN